MGETVKKGRIVYYDPNEEMLNSNTAILNGVQSDISNNISVDQEELNMYVNLNVSIPRRDINYNTNNPVFQKSFMSGSEIECDKKTYNLLTTSFTDAHFNEIKNNNERNREMFGIKDIDISFDQQFFPQVTIQFTDVRAYSLFQPTEYAYAVNGNQKDNYANNVASSFFSSLFRFPYPIFTLEVQGFYGDAVSFELAVNEFKSSFNATSGNFDVTITFIGYMYGVYTDIPINYVLTAPFFDNDGDIEKTYWYKQVQNGTFTFPQYTKDSNGEKIATKISTSPIPTYVEFLRKYSNLIKLNGGDNDPELTKLYSEVNEKYAKNKKEIDVLTSFLSACNVFYEQLKDEFSGNILEGKDHFLIFTTKSKEDVDKKFNRLSKYINTIYDRSQSISNVDVPTIKIEEISGFKDIKTYLNESLKKYYNTSNDSINGTIFLVKKAGWKRVGISDLNGLLNSNDINVDDVTKKITDEINDLNKAIDTNKDYIKNKATEIATKILGFKPSIENMYRMFYAYLDSFMHYITEKTKEISKGERTREYLGIDDDKQYKTDVPTNLKDIPPFPMVAKVINNKREIIYPGEVSDNFAELNIVNEIYNNIKNFSDSYSDAIKTINAATTVEKKSVFNNDISIPFLFSDLLSSSSPYSTDITDGQGDIDVEKLCWKMALRLCSFEYMQKTDKFNTRKNESEIEGRIEATNFYNSNPNIDEITFKKIANALQNNAFYNFLKNENIINNGQYSKIIDGTPNVLLKEWTKEAYNNNDINNIYTENQNSNPNNHVISFIKFNEENFNKLTKIQNETWVNDDETAKKTFYSLWDLRNNTTTELEYNSIIRIGQYQYYTEQFLEVFNMIKYDPEDSIYKQALFLLLNNLIFTSVETAGNYGVFINHVKRILLLGGYYKFADKDNVFNYTINALNNINNYRHVLIYWKNYIFDVDEFAPSEVRAKFIKLFENWCNGGYNISEIGDFPSFPNILKKINDEDSWETIKRGNGIGKQLVKDSVLGQMLTKFYEARIIIIYNKLANKNAAELGQENINQYASGFIKELEERYNFEAQNTTEAKETKKNASNEIKKSIYYTLKNIYDKWLCCAGSNHNFTLKSPYEDIKDRNNAIKKNVSNKNRSEFSRIIFANSFFMDISDEMVMDIKSLKEAIEIEINGEKSASFYEVMANLAEKNKSLFLSVPVFNNNLSALFKPCPYTRRSTVNSGPTYIFFYPGENSHILNDNYSEFTDDGISDIAGTYGVDSIGGDEINDFPFQAFGVAYGMQNQNYFKNISINMDTPSVTDYSIANTLHLAESSKNGDIDNASIMGQSLYPIFANRSYVCTVEMMGCAGITPFMHFQLNNIPMFKGVYVITNVIHKIAPGTFTTTFTGTRVAKYNYPVNGTVFDMDELVNRIGKNNEIYNVITERSNSTSNIENTNVDNIIFENIDNDIPNDGKEYSYNDLLAIKDTDGKSIVIFRTGRDKNKERFDEQCDISIRKFLYNLANRIKKENEKKVDNLTSGEPYKIIVTSTYNYGSDNSGRTCKSAHRHGYAVDLITENKQNSPNLFAHCASFIDDIDQLIWESKDGTNTMEDIVGNCIHVSTAKCRYPDENNCNIKSSCGSVRHQVWQASDPQGTIVNNVNLMAQSFKTIYKQLVDNNKMDNNDRYLKIRNDIINDVQQA